LTSILAFAFNEPPASLSNNSRASKSKASRLFFALSKQKKIRCVEMFEQPPEANLNVLANQKRERLLDQVRRTKNSALGQKALSTPLVGWFIAAVRVPIWNSTKEAGSYFTLLSSTIQAQWNC